MYTDDKVTVFTPLNFTPFFALMSKLHALRIKNLANKILNPKRKTILWIYHVEIAGLENYLNQLPHDFIVYDCVDNYPAFPKYNTPEKKSKVVKQEQYLTRKADIVFATTPGLVEKLKNYNENTFFTPNAGDYEKYKDIKARTKKIPPELANIPHPIIGFTGAIDEYKFDKNLFKEVVNALPGYSFVVFGTFAFKTSGGSPLADLGVKDAKNVYYMGYRRFDDLPKYFAGFDAYIIPLQLNDYTVGGCFPTKFHDALAAGLPTIVTDLPAYKPFESVSYVSKSSNEFSQNIRKALEENTPKKAKERMAVAQNNSYDGKVKNMLGLIASRIELK